MEKLTWKEIQEMMNKPVWDKKRKTWRVIEGYQEYQGKDLKFSDNSFWETFENKELYKEEK